MKIALISTPLLTCPPRRYGGLEQIVYDLGVEIIKLGNKVVLFAPKGSHLESGFVCETGVAPEKVEVDWLKLEIDAYKKYCSVLQDFDIGQGHNWFGCEYLYKSEHTNAHVCHTHHGGLLWRTKPPNVDKMNLIAISDWMRRVYESQGWTSKVVYNGIDLEKYPYKQDKGDRLLFVGRISKLKRPDVAIEVVKQVNMKLDIVGGTFVEDQNYVQNIRQLCESNNFGFYPDASPEKKIELMQNAKCLLFPSNMGEPFGLVPVEAMSVGTPVVAWDDGAVKEIIKNDSTGFVVPKTVENMVEVIKKIESIKPINCRRLVEQNFTRKIMAEKYLSMYNNILSGSEW